MQFNPESVGGGHETGYRCDYDDILSVAQWIYLRSRRGAAVIFILSKEVKSEVDLALGITYEEMGKKDLAVAAYRKVLELPIGGADDQDHKKEAEERLKKMGKPVFRQSRYKSPLTTLK